jgi:hypothetical protein
MNDVIEIGSKTYHKTSHDQFEVPLSELCTLGITDVPPYSALEINELPFSSDVFRITLSALHAGGPGASGEYSLSLKIFFEVLGTPDDAVAIQKWKRIRNHVRRTFEATALELGFAMGPDWTPFFQMNDRLLCVESFYKQYDWPENPVVGEEVGPLVARFNSLSNFRDIFLFVCYASTDRTFVDSLCEFLDTSDVPIWYDRREIRVGDSIVQSISDGLGMASHLAIVLSKASVASPWVHKEFSAALMRQLQDSSIRVLPVLVEDCQSPTLIADLRYADCRVDKIHGFAEMLAALV